MLVFTFCLQTGNTLWGNTVLKRKLSVEAKIWYPELFEYAEFNGGVHFLCFRPEIPFLAKFDPKSQNCPFQVKLDT